MERDSGNKPKSPLEEERIGIKPAYEWVEEKLEELRQKYELGRFKTEARNYKLTRFDEGEGDETLLGQEELNDEAVGYVAGYLGGKLKLLSVFADLKDRIMWVRKEGHKKEQFIELPRK